MMTHKKQYPKQYQNKQHNAPSISKTFATANKKRYEKGYQNQMMNASRKTETHTKHKTVIVTETVNIVDFNTDNFEFEFGSKHIKKNKYNKRRND